MTQEIEAIEKIAKQLEPNKKERKEMSDRAFQYINDFVETLPDAPGVEKEGTLDKLNNLSVEEEGKPFESLLDIIKNEVDKTGLNPASGTYLGYIPGGGVWASALGDFLAAAANRYAGVSYASPGAVDIENQMIRWLCSVMGYPDSAHGNLASGGSISNLTAIKAARDFHKINSQNVRKSVIYFTEQVHHSVYKALSYTGLHEAVIRTIPMDEKYRMQVEVLEKQMEQDYKSGLNPFLVIGTAGTTDTGAIDPLDTIADLCEKHKTWFHVDGAYGGLFNLVEEVKEKFKGIERSDSMVVDPHKTLFLPYGLGAALIKNKQALLDSNTEKASYMIDTYELNDINPADCGPELSKHFRGMRMWLPLHLHGVEPFRANLKEKLLLCRYFQEEVKKLGFETGPEPQLSIAIFRHPGDENNELNKKLVDELHKDGRAFFSSTTIKGKLWIRCAILSFRTHLGQMKTALQMIEEVSDKLKSKA